MPAEARQRRTPRPPAPSFIAGKFDRVLYPDSTGPALGPVWTEQHGSAAAVDSLRDSISYDGWERVIAVVTRKNGAVATRDTFQFTRTGNLRTTAGGETYDGTTDRLSNRVASGCGATWSYTYDRAGNLTQAVCGSTTWTYQYDALNQLRAVRYNATLIARYAYDVLGRRIAKRVYASGTGGTVASTRFVYHGAHVAFETDSAGTLTLRYTWGLGTDDLLAIRDAAGNHYYAVQDVLGSVRGLVKRDGTWQASWRYGPYGAVVDSAGSAPVALRYRWTGREYDAETGWYYFRARYYNAGVRRFVQEDPIGYGGGSNVYAYGAGGPLEGRDPSGLRMTPEMYAVKDLCLSDLCGGGGGSTWNLFPDWAFAAMAYGVQQQMAMENRYLARKQEELAQTGATTLYWEGRAVSITVHQLASIVYNETAGLRPGAAGSWALAEARLAIAEVALNRAAAGIVGGIAPDELSGEAMAAIRSGGAAGEAFLGSVQAVMGALGRPGSLDPTHGALNFIMDYRDDNARQYWPRWADGPTLYRFGPFTNVAPGQVPINATHVYINVYER